MSAISRDYYAILGVAKNATLDEINAQYKKLVRKNHPDRFKGQRSKYSETEDSDLLEIIDEKVAMAEEFLKLLNEAHEILSDPIKRRQYDDKIVESEIEEPRVTVSPKSISFGKLQEGEKKSSVFVIKNDGGSATSVNIDWEGSKPDWGDLVIEPDENNIFPIKVAVFVNTTGISSGIKDEKVVVTVDGKVQIVEIFLSVAKTAVPDPFGSSASTASGSGHKPNPKWIVGIVTLICIGYLLLITITSIENTKQQNAQATTIKQTQAYKTQEVMAAQQRTQIAIDEIRNTVFVEGVEIDQHELSFRFVNNGTKSVNVRVNSWDEGNCSVEISGHRYKTFIDGRILEPGERSGVIYCTFRDDPETFCQPTVSVYGAEPWNICPYKYKK